MPTEYAEYLYMRLPNSKLDIIDAGHFTWEADTLTPTLTSPRAGGRPTDPGPADRGTQDQRPALAVERSMCLHSLDRLQRVQ
ncbi:hypothetical protein BV882_30655 [Streptomyces sp. 46]|nr:hypothetical protein BV882_30655 [Streptomyces sp. 46]